MGRHISLIIPADRTAEEDRIIATLKAGQRIEHFDTVRLRSDGQPIWVSLTISPIKDEAGRVIGASKIVRDITSKRQAEERERLLLAEAAAANAKFRAFFEQGALFAGIMDVDGTLLEPNRLSWEGCGYTREQIVGKPFWEGPWWTPSATLVERIKAASAQAAAGQTFRAEMPYFVADGSERVADVTILPIKDEAGRVLFLAPTGIDITDRKRAEADRQKFVTLVENSTDFIGMCDLEGIPFFVNRAGLEMVGLDEHRAGPPHPRPGLLLPGRPAQDHGRVLPVRSGEGPRRDRGPVPALQDRGGPVDGLQGVDRDRSPPGRRSLWRRSARMSPSGGDWRTTCGSWRRTCPKPTAARTSSWRRWPTNSATRWPRSATPCKSSDSRPTDRPVSRPAP